MGIKLGLVHTRTWRDPSGNAAEIDYRDPTTEEWEKFSREFAQIVQGERKGDPLALLCSRFARDLVEDVRGFDVPEEMSQVEALHKFGGQYLSDIGNLAFLQNHGIKVDLGKSERSAA